MTDDLPPAVRRFRHRTGWPNGAQWIEFAGDRCTVLYSDGRREPANYLLEQAEDAAARGVWVEDGKPPVDPPAPTPTPIDPETLALAERAAADCARRANEPVGPWAERIAREVTSDPVTALADDLTAALRHLSPETWSKPVREAIQRAYAAGAASQKPKPGDPRLTDNSNRLDEGETPGVMAHCVLIAAVLIYAVIVLLATG